MAIFKSAFEKLTVENQQAMVEQLSPGGELFSLFEQMLAQLQGTEKRIQKDEAKTKVSLFAGLTMKEAIAWKLLGEKGLTAIGKGLGAIAEVIDGMQTGGKDAKLKMDAIATGIQAVMDIGPAVLKFAFFMLLATPMLIAAVVAAPLFAGSIYLIGMALTWASSIITDETLITLAALGMIGKSIFRFGGWLALSGLVYPFALIAMLIVVPTIRLVGLLMQSIEFMINKKTMKRMMMLGDVGKSIFNFGAWLALSLLVYPFALMAMLVVIPTIYLISLLMNTIRFAINKKTMKNMAMLGAVGKSIFMFGAMLALSLLVYPFALMAMVIVVPTILLIALIFRLMAPLAKGVKKTARALKRAGIAILVLGLALFAFGVLFPANMKSLMTIGMVMLVVIGVGFVFWLVGKMWKSILKGTLALALASLGLILFGYALAKVANSFKILGDPWEFMLQLGVALVGLGVVMAGWGMGFSMILQGAIGLALSGIAVWLFGWGLGKFAEALKISGDPWEFMAQVGVFLVGMGVMAAGWGAASPLILAGAFAMGVTGAALRAVAWGLEGFEKVFAGKAWKNMVAEHHQSDGFFGIGGGPVSNLTEILSSVGYGMLWNPVSAGFILAGSAAMIVAGGALKSVAIGVQKMAPVFKGGAWKDMIKTHHVDEGFFSDTPVSNLAHLVQQVGLAFNLGFGAFSIGAGAGAMIIAGNSLGKIADGIKKWQKAKISPAIAANVKSMVTSLATAFGEIGKKYGGTGFFGLGAGPLYDGIQSTMGMGDALTSIAKGMKAFSELRFPTYGDPNDPGKITEYITLDKGAMATITANVTMMVYSLSNAFGLIGRKFPNKPGSGLFGFLGGTVNPVQQGIQSTLGMGDALTGIAEGMKAFSDLKFYKYDDPSKPEKVTSVIDLTKGNVLKKVTDNIVMMIISLSSAFATIGRKYPKKKAGGMAGWLGFTTNGPVGVGIEQSGGMGGIVSGIAKGMKDFSELKFAQYEGTKITGYIDLTKGNVLKKVTKNIVNIILSLAGGFAEVARRFPRRAYKTWWGATRYAPDGTVGEGVKQSQGIGGVLTNIATGLKDFSELKFPTYKGDKIVGYTTLTSSGMKKVTANITNMIVSLMDGFGYIGKKYPVSRQTGFLGSLGVMMPGAVGVGIGAAKYLGRRLATIAIGMQYMANLRFPEYKGTKIVGYKTVSGDGFKKIARNIRDMIFYPMDAFGAVGSKYPLQPMGGILGKLGVMLPGAVGIGMGAAKYLGRRLATIAIGYSYMAALKFPEYDDPSDPEKITGYKTLAGDAMTKLAKNIFMMIYHPMDAFGRIGAKYGGDDTVFGFRIGPPKSDVSKGMQLAKGLPGALGYVFEGVKKITQDANVVKLGDIAANSMRKMAMALLSFNEIGPIRIFLLGKAVKSFLGSWQDGTEGLGALLKFQSLGRTAFAFERIAESYQIIGDQGPFAGMGLTRMLKVMDKVKLTQTARNLRHMSRSYENIAMTAEGLNLDAIKETTEMFKALAYLNQNNGDTAIEALGDELINAIEILGEKFKEFAQLVAEGKDPNEKKEGEGEEGETKPGEKQKTTSEGKTVPANPEPSGGGADIDKLIRMFQSGAAQVSIKGGGAGVPGRRGG